MSPCAHTRARPRPYLPVEHPQARRPGAHACRSLQPAPEPPASCTILHTSCTISHTGLRRAAPHTASCTRGAPARTVTGATSHEPLARPRAACKPCHAAVHLAQSRCRHAFAWPQRDSDGRTEVQGATGDLCLGRQGWRGPRQGVEPPQGGALHPALRIPHVQPCVLLAPCTVQFGDLSRRACSRVGGTVTSLSRGVDGNFI